METALLRLDFLSSRIVLLPLLILLAGCTAQAPYWERYRAAQPQDGGEAAGAGAASPAAPAPDSGLDEGNTAGIVPAALSARPPRPAPGRQTTSRVLDPANPFDDLSVLDPYLDGIASWYGPGFHGEATANGEIYNQYGLTAAHPMLPLGTKIEVENLNNGRKVWLRVNDRGPYKKGRVLDLSKLAAERLGIVDEGTAPVTIRVLRWPETIDAALGLRAYTQFVVQVVSRPEAADAEARRQGIAARFPGLAFLVDRPPGGQFSVIAGPYDDERAARAAALRLQQNGVTCLIRSYRK